MASDGETSCTNDPNFAVIYSFLKVFDKVYNLEIPSLTKLQELIENTQEVLDPLKDLHIRLLRRAVKSVLNSRWEKSLIKFCHQQGFHQEAWEIERFSYKKASTQVKLKVLKLLLEYQFTCHPKFKTAVNAISCNELRLKPVGRDKNGCVYWLQVDHEANLCLYKEDQDEETWHLIAKNREELVRVIGHLRGGEEICPLSVSNNEDSNSADIPHIAQDNKSHSEDDNEEFLSPESESDGDLEASENKNKDSKPVDAIEKSNSNSDSKDDKVVSENSDLIECSINSKDVCSQSKLGALENVESGAEEVIEEPVMIITGEGNGEDCESSFIIGEEIEEPILFVYGEGCGYNNETGNPEVIEQVRNSTESEDENPDEECLNGQYDVDVPKSNNKNKINKGVKLKPNTLITKRTLKKQSNEFTDLLRADSKKHCVREKSNSLLSKNNVIEKCLDENDSDRNTTTVHEKVKKLNKKNRRKLRKSRRITNKVVSDKNKTLKPVSDTDHDDSKTNIIEKRKSSLSAEDQDNEKVNSKCENAEHIQNEEITPEDTLPLKKIRLQTSQESENDSTHSKDVEASKSKNGNIKNKYKHTTEVLETTSLAKRKKIKAARKGKLKLEKVAKNDDNDSGQGDDNLSNDNKKECKSLKRSLLDDKIKSESQTETEDDEPIANKKRLKLRQKKISIHCRKKVEENIQAKQSSDESEEETLYNLAGKKLSKKLLKKKAKGKAKETGVKSLSDDDLGPVRQSRRIAQMKIKEEADRRHLEEVALRELKLIHKKKSKDDEDWKASGDSSSESVRKPKKHSNKWRAEDSTGPDPDSDSDEPLFEQEEPDLVFNKSDHEFSPESDLEDGEPVEPLKMARTLQPGKDEGFCKRCGSSEQPEWILLCDKCDSGYHASCLKPMLFLIPEGDWFCPPCNHDKLIAALENELSKYDELLVTVEAEREKRRLTELEEKEGEQVDDNQENGHVKAEDSDISESDSTTGSEYSSSSECAVYRLRTRRQLPVSYRAQEYDRLISSAIKEEYVEPTTSAGNQGRGKDISTIIEAAEEEKLKAEREAIEQGMPVEQKKSRRKQRRKPRKLNSLEVPSEDDDETDEDFKDTGMESSSEEISSSADRESSSGSRSSNAPRRSGRTERKERRRMAESSPEIKKKKKGVFDNTSSDSDVARRRKKSKMKFRKSKSRNKSSTKKPRRRGGLTQYDAEGNIIRARVTYGGLSENEDNDWSPKHRTRQKKINYTEIPNTESEDEMHKSSGKHMPDSSDEFKVDDSDLTSDSEAGKKKLKQSEPESDEDKKKALCDLINKTAVVPLEKLPDGVTSIKTESLPNLTGGETQISPNAARPHRGRGGRGGRGNRGHRGSRGRGGFLRASPGNASDDALSKLVGVKIKGLSEDCTPLRVNQAEREKKRIEREAKQAEKEARRVERIQKKEEKEKMREMKAKEREEKKLARIALQESKRQKKDKPDMQMGPIPIAGYGTIPIRPPHGGNMPPRMNMFHNPQGQGLIRHPPDFQEQRFHSAPRLQVRAELRGMLPAPERRLRADPPPLMREGTLSVAGSPQPFKPVTEEPSVITRMPHMMNQQYRGPMMYSQGNPPYGPRTPQNMMYSLHPGLSPNQPQNPVRPPYPQGYYPPHLRGLPPYPNQTRPAPHQSPTHGPPRGGPHGQLPISGPPLGSHGPHGHIQPIRISGPPRPHGPHPVPISQAGSHIPVSANPVLPNVPVLAPGPSRTSPGIPQQTVPSHIGIRTPVPLNKPASTPSPPAQEEPIKIKTEVKTEPEYRSPSQSPSRTVSPHDDPPRNHPKIKHTDNKDRRPRFPLGPYAPQYAAGYGPYIPPVTSQSQEGHSGVLNLQSRNVQGDISSPLQRMHQNVQQYPPNPVEGRQVVVERPGSPMHRPLNSQHLERPHHPSVIQQEMPQHISPYGHTIQHLRPQIRPPYGIQMITRHPISDRSSPQRNSAIVPPRYPIPYADVHRPMEKAHPQVLPPETLDKGPLTRPDNEVLNRKDLPENNHTVQRVLPTEVPQADRLSPTGDISEMITSAAEPFSKSESTIQRVHEIKMENVKEEAPDRSEMAPREEGSVFGGLVSYFSSQREDDMDA